VRSAASAVRLEAKLGSPVCAVFNSNGTFFEFFQAISDFLALVCDFCRRCIIDHIDFSRDPVVFVRGTLPLSGNKVQLDFNGG